MKTEKAQLVPIPSCLTVENPPVNTEDEFQYGGLVWRKSARKDAIEYTATQQSAGSYRIYQYPEGPSHGAWLWMVELDTLIDRSDRPSFIDMRGGRVVDTQEEALQSCLEAKDKFIADIKRLGLLLEVGNYATGFMDGQADIAKKIAGVLP